MELIELLRKLTAAHGPSGDEGAVRTVIQDLAIPYADEVWTDAMGNLFVHKKGIGPKVLFAAHMDSIGLIVTHVEKEGFLRVGRLGGLGPKAAAYTPFRFQNGVRGLYVPEEKDELGKLKADDFYLDIGAKDEAEACSMVWVGDTAVYDTNLFQNNSAVYSPYLDNRVSCAVLLAALGEIKESANDLYFVFTVQEEVGLRGARTAAWSVDPDYGIAIDVTDVDDTPGSKKYGTVQLGKGAAVKVMDSSVICHPAVVDKLTSLAQEQEIPVQKDILRAGGTDAGAIHITRSGVPTGGISVPCRYIHSPMEMANLGDVKSCIRLVCAFAQTKLDE